MECAAGRTRDSAIRFAERSEGESAEDRCRATRASGPRRHARWCRAPRSAVRSPPLRAGAIVQTVQRVEARPRVSRCRPLARLPRSLLAAKSQWRWDPPARDDARADWPHWNDARSSPIEVPRTSNRAARYPMPSASMPSRRSPRVTGTSSSSGIAQSWPGSSVRYPRQTILAPWPTHTTNRALRRSSIPSAG